MEFSSRFVDLFQLIVYKGSWIKIRTIADDKTRTFLFSSITKRYRYDKTRNSTDNVRYRVNIFNPIDLFEHRRMNLQKPCDIIEFQRFLQRFVINCSQRLRLQKYRKATMKINETSSKLCLVDKLKLCLWNSTRFRMFTRCNSFFEQNKSLVYRPTKMWMKSSLLPTFVFEKKKPTEHCVM